MKRPVLWAREALDNLKEQIDFIAQDNPTAALRGADRIRAACTALGKIPTGRPGRVSGTYEKSVSKLPYVIAYALSKRAGHESVVIVRVIHTARNWPADEWPK